MEDCLFVASQFCPLLVLFLPTTKLFYQMICISFCAEFSQKTSATLQISIFHKVSFDKRERKNKLMRKSVITPIFLFFLPKFLEYKASAARKRTCSHTSKKFPTFVNSVFKLVVELFNSNQLLLCFRNFNSRNLCDQKSSSKTKFKSC